MKRPPFLKAGDRVGLVSPAKSIGSEDVKSAVKILQRWGLEPVFGRHIFSNHHQFAGNDQQRAADIQEFLDDINVKAIINTRGGYGSHRIIDQLRFNKFLVHPKWIVGYSDITVFHSHIHNLGVETLHATMPLNFPKDLVEDDSLKSLRMALFGEMNAYKCSSCKIFRGGKANGALVGGNLSIINSLLASDSDIKTDGKILFIEDVGEYIYRIDRLMVQLKRVGKLTNLKALIIGGMSAMEDNEVPFGKSAEEVVFDAVKDYQFPVISGFPAGHIKDNFALFLGREAQLIADNEGVELNFL